MWDLPYLCQRLKGGFNEGQRDPQWATTRMMQHPAFEGPKYSSSNFGKKGVILLIIKKIKPIIHQKIMRTLVWNESDDTWKTDKTWKEIRENGVPFFSRWEIKDGGRLSF